jgi:hypothetical protein
VLFSQPVQPINSTPHVEPSAHIGNSWIDRIHVMDRMMGNPTIDDMHSGGYDVEF